MKKATIIIIIVASILVVLGVGMIAFSAAVFGGKFVDSFDEAKGGYSVTETVTLEGDAATLKSIDISMINSGIDVSKTTGETIKVTYSKKSKHTYDVDQTAQKIYIKETKKGMDFFFSIFTSFVPATPVTIEIPEGVKLDNVQLHTTNGKITVDSLKSITLGTFTVNGETRVTSSELDELTSNSTNGSLTVTASKMRAMRLKTVNGGVDSINSDASDLKLETVNGSLSATGLPGKASDYTLSADTVNGSVTVNGVKVSSRGNYRSTTSGSRSIQVNTVNGGVNITTADR